MFLKIFLSARLYGL